MNEFFGLRAMVVEDEGGVALLVEDMLLELGFEIVASVARLADACEVARTAELNLALMDVNLRGELIFPAARILRQRGVPFVFSTGYGDSGLPLEFRETPLVAKPFAVEDLQRQIEVALSA